MTWKVNPSESIITQILQIPAKWNFTGHNWASSFTKPIINAQMNILLLLMMDDDGASYGVWWWWWWPWWCVLEQCWRVFNLVVLPQELDEPSWRQRRNFSILYWIVIVVYFFMLLYILYTFMCCTSCMHVYVLRSRVMPNVHGNCTFTKNVLFSNFVVSCWKLL